MAKPKRLDPATLPRGVFLRQDRDPPELWIRYTDMAGKKRRELISKDLTAAKVTLAKETLEQRHTEVRQHKFDPDQLGRRRRHQMTVGEMFAHYLPLRVGVRNKGEDERYASYWTKLFGTLELDELTPADLDKWRVSRLTTPARISKAKLKKGLKPANVKPSTVNRALTYLKAFFNLALRDENCKSNPVQKLKAFAENNERTRYLSEGEESKLAAQMLPAHSSLVSFALNTGLRRGEMFSLRWEHVDCTAAVFKIPTSKSGKSRFVPINAIARRVLDEQKAWQDEHEASPWVFASRRKPSMHLSGGNFTRRYYVPALEKAGITDATFHTLRHTFASRLAMKGVPLHTIGKLIGDVTPKMVQRYSHLAEAHLQEAVSRLVPDPPVVEGLNSLNSQFASSQSPTADEKAGPGQD